MDGGKLKGMDPRHKDEDDDQWSGNRSLLTPPLASS